MLFPEVDNPQNKQRRGMLAALARREANLIRKLALDSL